MRTSLAALGACVLLVACGDDGVTPPPDASTQCTSDDQCRDESFCNGVERCDPASASGADGCVPGDSPCMASQVCDEADDRCETQCAVTEDADGDGSAALECGGDDCDDADAQRFVGNVEVCDEEGHDEDCDPETVGRRDTDGDGAIDAICCNGEVCGTDCDDARPMIFPGSTESCNSRDDDCDGDIDEELRTATYRPDCDGDGYGDSTVEGVTSCAEPLELAVCGMEPREWTTFVGDCDDSNRGINPGNPELCNGIDDDCDGMIDDVVDGVATCAMGETIACTSACGVMATTTCNATCTAFTACAPTEICNYCDDDDDGTIDEERALADSTVVDDAINCGGGDTELLGATVFCDAISSGPGGEFILTAALLDGSRDDDAAAFWLTPADLFTGWGDTTIEVVMHLRANPSTDPMRVAQPLGGWGIVIGEGTTGLGTARNKGIPDTIEGIAGYWNWSSRDLCFTPSDVPPGDGDVVRVGRLRAGTLTGFRRDGFGDTSCSEGEPVVNGAWFHDGVEVDQRMRIRYSPDDPSTLATNEETVEIITEALPYGGSDVSTFVYSAAGGGFDRPSHELPPGTPIKIGITVGTYTDTFGVAPGYVFGTPVEARVEFYRFTPPSGPEGPTYDRNRFIVTREGLCLPD